ncbi:MAG: hypothetical protein ACLQBU_07140, partial [Terriglobales bacterium]
PYTGANTGNESAINDESEKRGLRAFVKFHNFIILSRRNPMRVPRWVKTPDDSRVLLIVRHTSVNALRKAY